MVRTSDNNWWPNSAVTPDGYGYSPTGLYVVDDNGNSFAVVEIEQESPPPTPIPPKEYPPYGVVFQPGSPYYPFTSDLSFDPSILWPPRPGTGEAWTWNDASGQYGDIPGYWSLNNQFNVNQGGGFLNRITQAIGILIAAPAALQVGGATGAVATTNVIQGDPIQQNLDKAALADVAGLSIGFGGAELLATEAPQELGVAGTVLESSEVAATGLLEPGLPGISELTFGDLIPESVSGAIPESVKGATIAGVATDKLKGVAEKIYQGTGSMRPSEPYNANLLRASAVTEEEGSFPVGLLVGSIIFVLGFIFLARR